MYTKSALSATSTLVVRKSWAWHYSDIVQPDKDSHKLLECVSQK
jgi:hypothetical protein